MKLEKIENIALAFTVVGSLLIGWAAALNAQTKPSVELEAAMTKEQVNGDLRSSILAYQKIADDAGASREVRAKALQHLARCYERLGQDAQRVYQQIVRDFADQPAAAQSRGRLAALQQANRASTPATMTQRKIDIPWNMSFGPIDTDGRRVVYRSKTTKDLIYADLLTGTKRVVFKTPSMETPAFWQPSRDFSMVHIMFRTKPNRLAVMKTDGTGYRELIRDDAHGSVLGDGWDARWSWDNRYLLVVSRASNRLMAVDRINGARRELVTLKNGRLGGGNFSPDGRFVAYDVEPALPPVKGSVSQIFVLPVQGGEPLLLHEEPASESFRELDWTADGRYLAIASMRTGKTALHLLPVKDGQAAGAPLFVRYGNIDEGYTTKGGAFIYSTVKPGGSVAEHVASLDSNGRPSNWQRLAFRGDNLQDPNPDWAPDGIQIIYSTSDDTGSRAVVRNMSTGEDREIYPGPVGNCIWGVEQTKIFCTDNYLKPELISIAADSGTSERLGALAGGLTILVQSSRDGRAIYYWNVRSDLAKLIRRETATGQQTELTGWDAQPVQLSPDERWIYTVEKRSLKIRSVTGGDWKVLATLSEAVARWGSGYRQFTITPDGNWILYHDMDSAGRHALFRVLTTGGPPERLGACPITDLRGSMHVSPDSRLLIVDSWNNVNGLELWSLENFVPRTAKKLSSN